MYSTLGLVSIGPQVLIVLGMIRGYGLGGACDHIKAFGLVPHQKNICTKGLYGDDMPVGGRALLVGMVGICKNPHLISEALHEIRSGSLLVK